jgi:hypothetical protein
MKYLYAFTIIYCALMWFDFIVYVLKSSPKSSYFWRLCWWIGLILTVILLARYV